MLTYYQPFLLPFLRLTPYTLPHGITRIHFLSFEDALWTLLDAKKVPKNSVVLVPDFYCMDVVENIKKHGYLPAFYPLNDHLQPSKTTLDHFINKHKPSVIILFHACGITNRLLLNTRFIKHIGNGSIIIEDAVQRLINPEQVTIFHKNHFLIDSLRKVSPLSGSFIYGKPESLAFKSQGNRNEWQYVVKTYILYTLFRFVYTAGVLIKSALFISFAHKKILKTHDDLIGDSKYGYKGHWHDRFLHRYINFSKIEKLKEHQVKLYKTLLKPPSHWYEIHIQQADYKYLHVYPIGLRLHDQKFIQKLERFLEKHNAPVWFKFMDSPWATKRAVLFLPLGFHVSDREIRSVVSLISMYS